MQSASKAKPTGSTTEALGVVELATSTEAEDATDTQRAVTPRGVRAYPSAEGASDEATLLKRVFSPDMFAKLPVESAMSTILVGS